MRSYFKRIFSHAWIPGIYQYEYARRLGFSKSVISTGMYSADLPRFNQVFQESMYLKEISYPKKLLYVGRFVTLKGILELYQAFDELNNEIDHEWSLELIGAGPLKNQLQPKENIRIRDFVQPAQLPLLAKEAGIFVLPSHREPWAVVLHEFAATGLPLISTDAAGAATAFVKEGFNGWQFKAGDKDDLKKALRSAIQKTPAELLEMGRRSQELSRQISPTIWAITLYNIATAS